MLHLYQSNRLEKLADALAEVLRAEPGVPLVTQPILVASPGMGTWLQIQLARRLGVAAGFSFPLPARWLWQQYRALVPAVPEKSLWDKGPLSWVLWQRLDDILHQRECAPLRAYLDDGNSLKRYRLCLRLADLYDQYQVYRPDWLLAWARGREPFAIPEGQRWQPTLWRLLQSWLPADEARRSVLMDVAHWTALLRNAEPGLLPRRLVLFATSNLSAPLLRILETFAAHMEVHLFLLNPSARYWADLQSRRQVLRSRLQQGDLAEEALEADEGNPLLASLGAQGRGQWQLLLSHWDEFDEPRDDLFELPRADTLLGAVQQDVFTLHDGSAEPRPLPKPNISLHSCHSAMREVEVLHDRLCDLFAADPTLKPRDVIVMVPDMAPYAPLVEAVFGQAEHASIPWAVADRALADEVPLVRALLTLLKPSLYRFTANEVLDLLEVPALRTRFGLKADDLPLLREWIRDSGIRWGLDAGHRQRLGFPPNPSNTWQHGLQRLLLAVATGEQAHAWQEVLSLPGIQDGQIALAGRFAGLLETLRRYSDNLSRPRRPAEWRDLLMRLLDDFFVGDEQDELHLEQLRSVIAELVRDQQLAGLDVPVDADVVHAALAGALARASGGQRFLSGAVNLCTLMPMRTVPFRVVCLLGMNEADYPHREQPPGYDLLVRHPRVGDRSRRAEDRYLFLEALLAAREQLYVSWVGRDIHTNDPLPPSVVVADLIDYLDRAFVAPEAGRKVSERLLVEHALQPFSPRNFSAEREVERSHSPLWYRVAQGSEPAPAAEQALAPLAPDLRTLALDRLTDFFVDPAAAFLQERFRVRLDISATELDDDEPTAFSALERWQLRSESTRERLHGVSVLPLHERWLREGRLAPGIAGERAIQRALDDAQRFAERIAGHWPDQAQPLLLAETIEGVTLQGRLEEFSPAGNCFWSASRLFEKSTQKTPWLERPMKAGRLVSPWLKHLLLNASAQQESARWSRGWFEDVTVALRPLSQTDARAVLAQLLALYKEGMTRPLPCLPAAAWAALAGFDAVAIFEQECAGSSAAMRLFTTLPSASELHRFGNILWQPLRDHVEVTANE